METRVALAICAVLGSTLCGRAFAEAARRRARTLCELVDGLDALRIHMTGMLEPVRNALENSGCPILAAVAEEMGNGLSAEAAWRSARSRVLRRGGPGDTLTKQDVAALDALFSRLGQSGREEQEALLTAAGNEAARLKEEARAKAGEADKLYGSLGFLIGLMLALIVI